MYFYKIWSGEVNELQVNEAWGFILFATSKTLPITACPFFDVLFIAVFVVLFQMSDGSLFVSRSGIEVPGQLKIFLHDTFFCGQISYTIHSYTPNMHANFSSELQNGCP